MRPIVRSIVRSACGCGAALALALPHAAAAQSPPTATAVRPPLTVAAPRASASATLTPATRVKVPGVQGGGCPPVHACPPCEGAKRRLLPDGAVETVYADGTTKRVGTNGDTLTTYADGTSVEETRAGTVWRDNDGKVVNSKRRQSVLMEVQPATPPEDPESGSTLARWLARHDGDLLTALHTALANEEGGPQSLDRYLAKEAEQRLGLYAQIAARTQLLERLLAPVEP